MRRALWMTACLLLLPAAAARGGEVNWQDVSLDIPQPELGALFPDLELPDAGGVVLALGTDEGKPLLVAFCACYADTACPVLKTFEKIRQAYGDAIKTVLICCEIAPSWKEDGYEALLRRAHGSVDVVLIDEESTTRVPYLVGSYPTTYLVDEDFVLRYRGTSIADLNGDDFHGELARLFGDMTATP